MNSDTPTALQRFNAFIKTLAQGSLGNWWSPMPSSPTSERKTMESTSDSPSENATGNGEAPLPPKEERRMLRASYGRRVILSSLISLLDGTSYLMMLMDVRLEWTL